MIDTTQVSPLAASATTTATRATGRAEPSDYDTFLRMLTVQMQNQDPLNPIDSADYAVQLATFSGVEQQTRTNQLIEQLLSRFTLTGLGDLAGAVGQEALSTAPAWFDGTSPVDLGPLDPADRADRAVLVVRDASGQVVTREDVGRGGEGLAWTGQGITGATLAPGRYSFTLESMAGEDVLRTDPVASYARIEEVRRSDGALSLILRGGVSLPADQLRALRG
jgi:flagellar basal-body rod modification protein FlgD